MNKDIIYIDVEDDITAIIGKIKASKDKIIALVPPKRVGVLQSAVNLRLLNRTAQTSNKRLVLITNHQALVNLAGTIGIPVAKNLQSKPELPEISALDVDDGEDIIDGASLPVGDLAKTAPKAKKETSDKDEEPSEAVLAGAAADLSIDDKPVTTKVGQEAVKSVDKTKSGVKVPDFSVFRKRLFIAISAGVLFIVFLVWAIFFAPSAKVVITARTAPAGVSTVATLAGNAETNVAEGKIKSVTQEIKKDINVEYTATGEKNTGNKAVGTMTVTRTSISNQPMTVPAGTTFTSGDLVFVSTQDATLEGTQVGPSGFIQDSETVNVQAQNPGEEYNVSARSYQSSKSGVSADGSNMTGGTTKMSKVPTASDIEKATAKLELPIEEEVRAELADKFVNGEVIIEDSFKVDKKAPVSTPKVGEEAKDGTGKLTQTITYTITAIPKADVELYLKADLDKQLATRTDQRVYDYGVDGVSLVEFNEKKEGSTVRIVTTGQIGPNIDEVAVKDKVKGKIYGDAQAILEGIDGVVDADVQFPFFWVRTVPNDVGKITVEFKLENGE